MIDYFFKFSTEAVAIADASGTLYYAGASWDLNCVAPNLQVWRVSQDVSDGQGGFIHTYLTGWYGCVSLDHTDSTLVNHPSLQIAIDRTKAALGQVAILKSNLGAVLQDIRFSPVFAGSNYPFGNLQ